MTAADQSTRDLALDPAQSFIVQAPAGSGKTELLMQRYLALLTTVEHPEEIIAITFTRKATAEMRGRILASLDKAAGLEKPDQAHEQKTWQLAQQVLIRDKELNWNLQLNPNRLRIQTIDALCASLARQMPILSRAGVNPVTVTDASDLYRQAARATLQELARSQDVAFLLGHLDNNWQKLEAMITSLLQKRDHWLRYLPVTGELKQERENLEASLCAIIHETLEQTLEKLPESSIGEWIKLANFAAGNLQKESKEIPLSACAGIQKIPDPFHENLHLWEGLIELVLTQADGWRKTVNKNQGFPAPSGDQKQFQAEMKSAVPQLIEQLQEIPDLLEDLRAIRLLPKPSYSDDQWDVLQALFVVLKLAVAQLQIVFREHGQVDFTEVSIAAVYALGHAEQPTDLALSLDYKIRHLLVDEFQDTSVSQYSLLERITIGWEPEDGRTLFLVGDPMQSIYRFREADVGLFINVQQQQALGHIQLVPLELSVNFRSERVVVDWVNRTFRLAMPAQASVTSGAVSYTPSEAYNDRVSDHQLQQKGVMIHPLIDADKKQEAKLVCDQVRQAIERNDTVAVLVRSKSHLVQITTQLKDQKLAYQAVEIEALSQQPVIRDLYSLTCALLHLADKTAWLAVLRAPWCGMTLVDLESLVEKSNLPVWSLINNSERIKTLSDDGQLRVAQLQTVFQKALAQSHRTLLSRWVEGVWVSLSGPACLQNDSDLEDTRSYFELLEGLDEGGELASLERLEQAINNLFATPTQSVSPLPQLMTIHKSKGLEFDTVIIPALDRQSKNDDRQLLQWTEWHNVHEDNNELLLAPIEEVGQEKERINLYLASLEKERTRHETVRLLYVAITRARQQLHLIGRAEHNSKGDLKSPDQRSLLARIWPSVEAEFTSAAEKQGKTDQTDELAQVFTPFIRRLPTDWALPELPDSVQWKNNLKDLKQTEDQEEPREFIWAGAPARHIGTVVHRLLQQIAEEGTNQWDQKRVHSITPLIETLLLESSLSKTMLPMAVKKVQTAIEQTLQDERGQWIMSKDHQQARNEYALTGLVEGEMINAILDRTFIDEQGTRWIIDYKTGGHEGGGLESFLDNEQLRYREQLECYAKLMAKLESCPIRLALYFPLLAGWREWSS